MGRRWVEDGREMGGRWVGDGRWAGDGREGVSPPRSPGAAPRRSVVEYVEYVVYAVHAVVVV